MGGRPLEILKSFEDRNNSFIDLYKSRGYNELFYDKWKGKIMSERTLTRADLAEAVYEQVGLSRNESSDLVEQVLDEVMNALISGENVKLSSFGSFSIREKGERIGRNPKTGVEVPITPRRVLVFRASHVLKDRISKGA